MVNKYLTKYQMETKTHAHTHKKNIKNGEINWNIFYICNIRIIFYFFPLDLFSRSLSSLDFLVDPVAAAACVA